MDAAPALPVYTELRERVLRDFSDPIGDPAKLDAAVTAASDTTPPPRRLLLGSDAYQAVHASRTARVDEVDAQREHASITDHT